MIAADDDTEKSMMDMARAERAELAAFLTTLTLQHWESPIFFKQKTAYEITR